jgi:23S rRNA (cytidine1920-2'-O)/16S rRNA (cytidine1409-2'-O)-methyltransferase
LILVNDVVINKPHHDISLKDKVEVKQHQEYVSRGAYKLLAAIEHWNISFKNKVILDIGASTGGFSQVSVMQGAKYVYAVDVGSNQLHQSLHSEPKIISYENLHLKDISKSMFKYPIDIVVADLSFISLTKLIDKLIKLFNYSYQCIFLIKPQFELSPSEINKGSVRDPQLHKKAIDKIIKYAKQNNYQINGVISSPIKGNKLDNIEFLIYMIKA